MATAAPILNIQSSDNELAKQTVFIKLHLGLLGNSRKVSSSQVAVDADKALIRVSKTLLDSPELQAIRTLDGDIRHFLYDMCLPFEVGIHLLPLGLVGTVDERLQEFKDKRGELVESFLSAYPRLCQEAAGRLRTLYNPADYPPVDVVDDQELKEQVEKARALLEGVSTDALRNMPLVRAWVRDGMAQVAAQMDVLVGDRVNRKFRFDA
jgi:hypothetical protein